MTAMPATANAKTRIKVLMADDHAIVREGVRLCLEGMGDIDVVGEAEDGHQAVRLVGQLAPDVAVLDVTMPRLNGIEALRQIRRDHPRTRVVMLSMHDNEAYVTQALQAGASGYVLKRTAATELAAEGLTTREIAEQLVVSTKTAEHHRASAMAKLNLHSQTELVKYAIRSGLIEAGG